MGELALVLNYIKQIDQLQKRLATVEAESDKLKTAIQVFSDKWKYYDNQTITGLDDLRDALAAKEG